MNAPRLALGCILLITGIAPALHGQQPAPPKQPGFTLTSPAFPDGGEIPPRYTAADPMPISPRLEWANVPMGTVSFVLMLRDPDVAFQKSASDILHYMVINIPGTARSMDEALPSVPQLPDGTILPKNLRGVPGYLGPGAPAPGPHHHYTWDLYALDTKLDLGPETTRAEVTKAMEGHAIGKAVLVGRFHR